MHTWRQNFSLILIPVKLEMPVKQILSVSMKKYVSCSNFRAHLLRKEQLLSYKHYLFNIYKQNSLIQCQLDNLYVLIKSKSFNLCNILSKSEKIHQTVFEFHQHINVYEDNWNGLYNLHTLISILDCVHKKRQHGEIDISG